MEQKMNSKSNDCFWRMSPFRLMTLRGAHPLARPKAAHLHPCTPPPGTSLKRTGWTTQFEWYRLIRYKLGHYYRFFTMIWWPRKKSSQLACNESQSGRFSIDRRQARIEKHDRQTDLPTKLTKHKFNKENPKRQNRRTHHTGTFIKRTPRTPNLGP